MQKYSGQIYYPKNKGLDLYASQHRLNKFILLEQHDADGLQKLCTLSIHALARMTDDEKEIESERFFIYLISNPRRDIKQYLEPILNWFHIQGFLRFKKQVYNESKQKVIRYRVTFQNKNKQIIANKSYSSLRQLSDDIGKKMTSLHYQLFKIG